MLAHDTIQVNIRLQEDIVQKIDSLVSTNHYRNRQELVRSAIRDFLKREVSLDEP